MVQLCTAPRLLPGSSLVPDSGTPVQPARNFLEQNEEGGIKPRTTPA